MTRPLNRRQFVQTTAAATAALAAPAILTSARGADAPANTVTLAVVGTNGRGSTLASNFAGRPGCKVAYICDVDSRAIAKAVSLVESRTGKAPQGVADFRTLLDEKSLDAFVIATPDHWHAPATILACTHGKHVYVEKPASHNAAEGELMVAAAGKHKRIVQMGSQRRSSVGVAEAIGRVQSGDIGRVLFARGWINSTRPNIGYGKRVAVPEYLDYELWQGPAPRRPYQDNVVHYNWHWFWNWGTGELGNNGIHALDLCRWGLAVDYPKRVTCGGGKFFFDDDQQTPDTQIATFNFGDSAINWEHRTWHRRGFEGQSWGATFYGDKGSLVIDSSEYRVANMEGKQIDRVEMNRGDIEHLDNFLDAIRGNAKLNAEIAEGVKSTLLCHLGNIAYRTASTVNFDPEKRKIIDNPPAEALWGREYEPGWEVKV